MMQIFYGCLMGVTGYVAVHSRCEMLQKIAATLFVGWLVYTGAQPHASFEQRVEFNLYLDMAQFGFMSLLYLSWRDCRASNACIWVGALFLLMILAHLVQILAPYNLYLYYLSCNLLFTAQLLVVIRYAWNHARNTYNSLYTGDGTWKSENGSPGSKVVPMRKKNA